MNCVFKGMTSRGAETAKRYRERRDADPVRRREYLEKERERWKRDKETGKKRGINKLTERAKRAKRKKWRESKRQARARAKASALLQSEIPPNSPGPENQPVPGPSRLGHFSNPFLVSCRTTGGN